MAACFKIHFVSTSIIIVFSVKQPLAVVAFTGMKKKNENPSDTPR